MSTYYHGLIFAPECGLCPLRGRKQVPPDGAVPSKLLFVGEGPGGEEVQEGRAFVGPTGKLLWYMCKTMGLPAREDIWVTNAALCRPAEVRLSNGAVLSKEETKWMSAKYCRRRLLFELQHVINGNDNAVIVPIGKLALWSCSTLVKPSIGKYRGAVIRQDLNETLQEANEVLFESMIKNGLDKLKKGK